MAGTQPEQRMNLEDLKSAFREPGLTDVLKPGMSGTACCNIRTALSSLGYRREWSNADCYDAELQSVVRQFQADNGNKNTDGWVGPGTRGLLAKQLLTIGFDFTRLLKVFEYDVALSFAGEDREYADELASHLTQQHIRVFYDSYEQADLWGKNLIEHLEEVYARRARFCVMFTSKAYAQKAWPTHERRAAQERAFQDIAGEYILPVRLDDTKIPGLPSTVAYIDIQVGIERISKILVEKIRSHRSRPVSLRSV